MATFETTRSGFGGPLLSARLSDFIAVIAHRVIEWNDRRVTRDSLLTLSDRELDDIGLSRSDVYDL